MINIIAKILILCSLIRIFAAGSYEKSVIYWK